MKKILKTYNANRAITTNDHQIIRLLIIIKTNELRSTGRWWFAKWTRNVLIETACWKLSYTDLYFLSIQRKLSDIISNLDRQFPINSDPIIFLLFSSIFRLLILFYPSSFEHVLCQQVSINFSNIPQIFCSSLLRTLWKIDNL